MAAYFLRRLNRIIDRLFGFELRAEELQYLLTRERFSKAQRYSTFARRSAACADAAGNDFASGATRLR